MHRPGAAPVLVHRAAAEAAEELLRRAWVVAVIGEFTVVGIQPTIPDGERLLGLGCVKGTPILAGVSHGHPSCYKTASGEVHDTDKIMGSGIGLTFSGGVFTDAKGQQYHGFVCSPPPPLAAEGVHKILVWRRVGDPASRPAIVSVEKKYEAYSTPAAEAAAFD